MPLPDTVRAEETRPENSADVADLLAEKEQLQTALASRVVIEQAKGVLAERLEVSVEEAFAILRYSARSARMRIHELAGEVVPGAATPPAIIRGLAREVRWRTLATPEPTRRQQPDPGHQPPGTTAA